MTRTVIYCTDTRSVPHTRIAARSPGLVRGVTTVKPRNNAIRYTAEPALYLVMALMADYEAGRSYT